MERSERVMQQFTKKSVRRGRNDDFQTLNVNKTVVQCLKTIVFNKQSQMLNKYQNMVFSIQHFTRYVLDYT